MLSVEGRLQRRGLHDTLSLPDVTALTAAPNLAVVKLNREASVLCGNEKEVNISGAD